MYDMSNLKKLKTLGELRPPPGRGSWPSTRLRALADGAIPAKMKERDGGGLGVTHAVSLLHR